MSTDLNERLEEFVVRCEQLANASHGKTFPFNVRMQPERGKKYVRIVSCNVDKSTGTLSGRSAHCFVDLTNGNILKAEGWKSPHKTPRGNIYADDFGMDCMTPYGCIYLR